MAIAGAYWKSRPLRRAIALFWLAAVAHLVMAGMALVPGRSGLEPLALLATPGLLDPAVVALLGVALASLSALAAHRLARLRPGGRRLGVAAALLSIANPPLATVLALLALAHLWEPRVQRAFRDVARVRRGDPLQRREA